MSVRPVDRQGVVARRVHFSRPDRFRDLRLDQQLPSRHFFDARGAPAIPPQGRGRQATVVVHDQHVILFLVHNGRSSVAAAATKFGFGDLTDHGTGQTLVDLGLRTVGVFQYVRGTNVPVGGNLFQERNRKRVLNAKLLGQSLLVTGTENGNLPTGRW